MGTCLKIKKNAPSSILEKKNKVSDPENAYKANTPAKDDPENVAESRFPFRQTNHLNINNTTTKGIGNIGKDDKSDQSNHLNVSLQVSKNGGGKSVKEDDISEESPRTLAFNKREKKEVPKLD